MNRDHPDVLIDQLLREILGGDRPRDLTERVMAHAKIYDRTRRRWWIGAASGIAASIAIAIGSWVLWPQAYPDPNLEEGDVAVLNGPGDKIERGSQLETNDVGHANIAIGGYVNVAMEPQTAMTIGGSKFAEKVTLARGTMDVAVIKKKGTFDVAVGAALVHVTGTKFRLNVQDKEMPESGKKIKQLLVSVKEGSVVVSGVGDKGPVTIAADSPTREQTFEISSQPMLISRPKLALPFLGTGIGTSRAATGRAPQEPPATTPRHADTIPTTTQVPPSTPRPAANTRPAPAAALSRPLQVIIEPGRVELNGMLGQTLSNVYVLETPDLRRVLIFAQQPPFTALPRVGSYIHVVWENGKALSVDPIPTTSPTKPSTSPAI